MGQHVINNNSDHQLIAGVGCMITVKMLGSFQLEVNGQPIPVKNWKSRKALTLFKYLAHCPGKKYPATALLICCGLTVTLPALPIISTPLCII